MILKKPNELLLVLIIITFVKISFRFQLKLCHGSHHLMENAIRFNCVEIFSVKGNDYRIHFWYINKDYAINLLANAVLREKVKHYEI